MRTLVLPLGLTLAACTGGIPPEDDAGDDVIIEACDEQPGFTGGVSTLAGCDRAGASDGVRSDARFSNPVSVARGADQQVYVADFDNDRIRVVDDDGNVATLVEQAGFERPFALEIVGDTLFVATDRNDQSEHSTMTGTIWRVDTGSGEATVIVRNIGRPRGMVALPDGRLALSDYQHHAIRILDPDTGAIANLAGAFDESGMLDGRGAAARFAAPYGMAVLADGRIAVADYDNNRIRAIEMDGDVTTLAGSGVAGDQDGAMTGASFNAPQGLAVTADGTLYVSDTDNFTIRRIAGGHVTTVAGAGEAGFADSEDLRAARFFGLEGLDVSPDGTRLWVADGTRGEDLPYHRVRLVELD